jgi:phosphoglycolate phosphatase-like HAD superfamily hydrolase
MVTAKPLVILDFDGVVRDPRRASHAATRAALKAVGLPARFSVDEYWHMRGFKEFNNRRKALAAIYSVAAAGKNLDTLLRTAPKSILELQEKHPADAVIELMSEVNRKVATPIIRKSPPFNKGARTGLAKLARVADLSIVSDSPGPGVRFWMRKKGICKLFAVILCKEDVPEMKPSPKGLWKAMKLAGAKPGKTFYVGDAESDVTAALAAGIIPIGVEGGMAPRKLLVRAGAKKVFRNLAEFAAWLKKS